MLREARAWGAETLGSGIDSTANDRDNLLKERTLGQQALYQLDQLVEQGCLA